MGNLHLNINKLNVGVIVAAVSANQKYDDASGMHDVFLYIVALAVLSMLKGKWWE